MAIDVVSEMILLVSGGEARFEYFEKARIRGNLNNFMTASCGYPNSRYRAIPVTI